MNKIGYSLLSALILMSCAEQDEVAPKGEMGPGDGPDLSLEAISPTAAALDVGLAGETPANIARYLLARGASGAQISPDGSQIAFRYSITGAPQLWTVSAAGGAPRQLTYGNGMTFFRWMPDGAGLIYGADNDGNEQEAYYRIDADGGQESLLMGAVSGGFRRFGDISDDGSTIVYSSTERNGLDFDIYKADLSSGESERVYEGEFGFFVRSLSPDGRNAIVIETHGEDADKLYLLDMETGELSTISAPDPRANHGDGGFSWRPDGSGFFFASNVDREFSAVFSYSMEAGTTELFLETARDVTSVDVCGEGGNVLVFTENIDGFEKLHVRELGTGAVVSPPALPEGRLGVSCTSSSNNVSIGINGWNTPGDVYVWNMESATLGRAVASTYAGLDPASFVRPESFRAMGRDGVELQGLLYLPPQLGADDMAPPVVFEVHGGPTAQSTATFDAVTQYHVNRGIAVFKPNVRGSTGFGRTYTTLDDREKRRDSVRDLVDLGEALRGDGRVDMDRAAVSGGSYGGYVVNAALALYPDVFVAGVCRYGVADWVTALEVASPALKASDRIEYGDIREQEWIDFYTENSPIKLADQIKVPVLYSHGVMDPRIDIYETEVMVRTLRQNGIEAPYIRIPDEGHGWRKLSNRLFYYQRQVEFLETVLADQ